MYFRDLFHQLYATKYNQEEGGYTHTFRGLIVDRVGLKGLGWSSVSLETNKDNKIQSTFKIVGKPEDYLNEPYELGKISGDDPTLATWIDLQGKKQIVDIRAIQAVQTLAVQ